MQYADVWIPAPLPDAFTYAVPDSFIGRIQPGMRVVVPFGKYRVVTGLLVRVHNEPPKVQIAKHIIDLLDEKPTCTALQMKFFEWLAAYYMTTAGEVFQAALPSALKIQTESYISIHPTWLYSEDDALFSRVEHQIIQYCQGKESVSVSELQKSLGITGIFAWLERLKQKKAILFFLDVNEKYQPKKQAFIEFNVSPNLAFETWLKAQFDSLQKKPKQLEVLQVLYILCAQNMHMPVPKAELKKQIGSTSALDTLIKNNILVETTQIVPRFELTQSGTETTALPVLSQAQQEARSQIEAGLSSGNPVLLHGVTGSGKTELYIHHIAQILAKGKTCLVLLPEIMLTTQLIGRFSKHFGSIMGVYHSKFSDNERAEVWHALQKSEIKLIVGVRSAIFLPFVELGLIIVDEEHDPSYKQQNPAPRYHARDAALYLAKLHKADVILGSATPSVESFFLATVENKYTYVSLFQRFGTAELPEIVLIDLKEEKKRNTLKDDVSSVLLHALVTNYAASKQSILLQNRRGYAPYLVCETCSHVMQCPSCDVSLTVHQKDRRLRCHYCGYNQVYPKNCPSCQSFKLRSEGFGTERLEEEIQALLPHLTIDRMDQDTTRTRGNMQRIVKGVENRKTDILIGTQMVSKGLDFENVTLIGVFDIDRLIHFPDFRSEERVYQLLQQVAGRAGRRSTRGQVYIQTLQPNHNIFQHIQPNVDPKAFYHIQLKDRMKFGYPPYTRLIKIIFKDKNVEKLRELANIAAQGISINLGKQRVLGPEAPVIEKIQDVFIQEILLKLERNQWRLTEIKKKIQEQIGLLLQDKTFQSVHVIFDVDPI